MKYKYTIEKPKEFMTKIMNAEQFVVDAMNAVGEAGGEIIAAPVEFTEPSKLTDGQGNPIPYYGVILFVKYPADEPETNEPA